MLTLKARILVLLTLPLLSGAFAHEIDIWSSKAVYQPGDTITISGRVVNSGERTLNLSVELLLEDLGGRVATAPLHITTTVQPGQEVNLTLMEATVDNGYYNGLYRATARLIDGRFVADEDELILQVQGAPEDLALSIRFCEDPYCQDESLVFIKNEKVYIRYSSPVEGVSVAASISGPDGSTTTTDLPHNITAKAIGAYVLVVSASSQGYRDLTLVKSFAVIEGEPGIVPTERRPSHLHLEGPASNTPGGPITLEGHLEPVHADANVTIVCEKEDGMKIALTAITDDEGNFRHIFRPKPSLIELARRLFGTGVKWTARATWDGDSNHLNAESDEVDFVVEHGLPLELLILAAVAILLVIGVVVGLARRRR